MTKTGYIVQLPKTQVFAIALNFVSNFSKNLWLIWKIENAKVNTFMRESVSKHIRKAS